MPAVARMIQGERYAARAPDADTEARRVDGAGVDPRHPVSILGFSSALMVPHSDASKKVRSGETGDTSTF